MSKVLDNLIKEYQERENRGVLKYGTTMDRKDLTLAEWVQHALEEAMDLSLYLSKIKELLNDTQGYPNHQKANSTINASADTNREITDIGTPV